MDPIISALILVAVVGLICYVVIRFIPMDEIFQKIILAVAVIAVILYLLRVFGIFHFSN